MKETQTCAGSVVLPVSIDGSLRQLALLGAAIVELGHDVRLIPSAYVKPFVKRQSDMADAEAICEAG